MPRKPGSGYTSTTCPTCGNAAPVRVDGSIGRHQYIRNNTTVVCSEGDRGNPKSKPCRPVVTVPAESAEQYLYGERLKRLIAWIDRQRGYRVTARREFFVVVGPRADRKPVHIPKVVCGDHEWKQTLSALYRLGLTGVHRSELVTGSGQSR